MFLGREVVVTFQACRSTPLTAQAEQFLGIGAKMLQAAAPSVDNNASGHYARARWQDHHRAIARHASVGLRAWSNTQSQDY